MTMTYDQREEVYAAQRAKERNYPFPAKTAVNVMADYEREIARLQAKIEELTALNLADPRWSELVSAILAFDGSCAGLPHLDVYGDGSWGVRCGTDILCLGDDAKGLLTRLRQAAGAPLLKSKVELVREQLPAKFRPLFDELFPNDDLVDCL